MGNLADERLRALVIGREFNIPASHRHNDGSHL